MMRHHAAPPNQHPQPMVVDVDLSALRRPLPVHKSAPEGSPETLKNQIPKFMHTNGEAAVAPPWGEFNGIDVPKNLSSLIDFCLIFSFLLIFDFLTISVSPRREHYF